MKFNSKYKKISSQGSSSLKESVETGLNISSYMHETDHSRMLYIMTAALGERDSYTQAHALRVAAYTQRIALRAGLSQSQVRDITLGGMLHDIGKLALSDRIFSNKRADLSDEMLNEVHSHPLIGAALLRHFNCKGTICDVVLYHHERIDGSGYPFGLRGKEIPLGAKIVSVADCFDAITTDRPYQRRKSRKQALLILDQMAEHHLDADLVALLREEIGINGMEEDISTPSCDMPPLYTHHHDHAQHAAAPSRSRCQASLL